ncbi:class I SAM-dependent methyltransferase [Aestuariibacter salexigens]|uniref:class I SAM-dependent methyltransferase n=1 Tax=Aestuariibacter salexigens TaxID=226010 RepID=UPI000409BC48|nr:class I SAM-dependent methyltransferase [Aestuariibacter salexigens]
MKTLLASSVIAISLSSFNALADNHADIADKVKQVMQSEIRTERDTERDRNRKPAETLAFFGLKDDMRIVELIPGGGWYAKILAPLMRDSGEYYAAIGTNSVKRNLADKPGFDKMSIVAEDAKLWREEGDRFYSLELDSLGVSDADMVLTFRNYHNFNESGRMAMNNAAFAALKPGGIYAVVDHTARHMEPDTPSNGRRVDPVKAIVEIQRAGFELVDYSTLHYREDDELEYEVGAKSVTGNTDRWTLKFRKPD